MLNTYVIATPPLSRTERESLGLGDVMVWDTEQPYHYLRWTPDHRLLFGGADRPHRHGSRRAVLGTKARELVPGSRRALSVARGGGTGVHVGRTVRRDSGRLPYIGSHRRYPRHLFALGYGGNGMTFGFMAGRVLARIIDGAPRPEDALFSFGRTRRRRSD